MRMQGRANCPLLNEPRQIQANSRGDRDGNERLPLVHVRLTSVHLPQSGNRTPLKGVTVTRELLGIADNGAAVDLARIESRLANLPIYVYDLRDSLTYKPQALNLGSTDPIALSIVTYISTTLRALTKAALTCRL